MQQIIEERFNENTYGEKIVESMITILHSLLIIVCSVAILLVVSKIVTYIINKMIIRNLKNESLARKQTLTSVIKDLIRYITFIIIFLVILVDLGINLGVLIASAGFISIIIGIGAKDLISDMVTGFFIVFEGYYDVGDYIKVQEYEGTVKSLGIKATILETYNGEMLILPNSKIVEIINYSKNDYISYINLPLVYYDNFLEIEKMIEEQIIKKLRKNTKFKKISYLGVEDLESQVMKIQFVVVSTTKNRFEVRKILNKEMRIFCVKNNLSEKYNSLEIIKNKGE